jgi:uncharacterized membrane protein
MAVLIAIAYPDEATAATVQVTAEGLARALGAPVDAVASIVRTRDGTFEPNASGARRASWELFWSALFGTLFFVPVRRAGAAAAPGRARAAIARSRVDEVFVTQVRAAMAPQTSALFVVVDRSRHDQTVAALDRFGGVVLCSRLSSANEDGHRPAPRSARRPEPVAV